MLHQAILGTAKKMLIDFEGITAEIEHGGTKGDAREEIVKRFLNDYIPESYGIAKGLVVDSSGQQSKQEDVIIYDKASTPRFLALDSAVVMPVESVRAIIEVKSTLTSKRLAGALANMASVRALTHAPFRGAAPQWRLPPVGLVFAYTSDLSLERIVEELRGADEASRYSVTAIVCLDRGCVVNLERSDLTVMALFPGPQTTIGRKDSADAGQNLMLLYLLLMHGLFQVVALTRPCPDLTAYASKSGFMNPDTHVATEDASGCEAVIDGHRINLDRIRELNDQRGELVRDPSPERLRAFVWAISEATGGLIPPITQEDSDTPRNRP